MKKLLGKVPFLNKFIEKEPEKRTWKDWLQLGAAFCGAGIISGVLLISMILFYFAQQVPDFRTLADYKPSLITKVYDRNGEVLAEYAKERRIYTPYNEIPESLIKAYLAAEDTSFYTHGGFELKAIIRALLVNTFTNRRQGASTITQQVAKTFFLSSEQTYVRKIKEVILARRVEKAFSKEEILELYLNQIYLGNGAYGVAAAAQTYYGKKLKELNLQQRAMLAGLPKAPSAYNPLRRPRVARLRRDVIINRMLAENFITNIEAKEAMASNLELNRTYMIRGQDAPHFSEHVRRYLEEEYGEKDLYHAGLQVFTTLDKDYQKSAEKAVLRGLREYDRRHGYKGPVGHMSLLVNWQSRLIDEEKQRRHQKVFGLPAVVLNVSDELNLVSIGLPNDVSGTIPLEMMKWAREYKGERQKGPTIKRPSDVLEVGDIILVRKLLEIEEFKEGGYKKLRGRADLDQLYSLEQVPKAQASLVALDAKTGAIRAMVGGSDPGTGFNRAVQAKRQAGSAFKPFVYALALEKGYTPASMVLDAPVVLRTGELDGTWKPQNYSEKVYGPSTLRRGLVKSRNLMTIRLARKLGMGNIIGYARRFGFTSEMERNLSTALGSASFSLLELTSGYSVFANAGKRAGNYFLERIQDSTGSTLFSHMETCFECRKGWSDPETPPIEPEIDAPQVIEATTAYQVMSMLEGVVQRGTGWRAKAIGKPVGGKTGTTNDYKDAWFVGASPTLVVGVWFGFDTPKDLGASETGSRAASPIWTYFLKGALKKTPAYTFSIPEGLSFVRIDEETGELPTVHSKKTILEAFKTGSEPGATSEIMSSPTKRENTRPIDLHGLY